MEYFNFLLTLPEWVLLGVAVVAAIVAVVSGFVPMLRVTRDEREPELPPEPPRVSVIALSSNDTDPTAFIEAAVNQRYPDYEVIIVHEATSAANDVFAERYGRLFRPAPEGETGCRGLHFCFYPPGAHALSRKKLALSIGIKGAKGDVILTTATSCAIPSADWLTGMMRHFTPGVDIVLGHARYDYGALPKSGRPLQRFIHMMTTGQWMASAVDGLPVRGDGYNLAYRKELFFRSKGFAGTNDLMNGEDDIFVAANAHPGNTEVELAECSSVAPTHGSETARMFADARDHYRFTSTRLPRASFVRQGVASAAEWAVLLCGVATAVLGMPNLMPAAAVLLILGGVWAAEAFIYRRLSSVLGDSRKWALAPLLMLARPIDNFLFDMRRRNRRFTNYTLRRQ